MYSLRFFCHLREAVCQKVIMILEITPILTLPLPKMSRWFVEVSLGSHLNTCGLTWGSSSFTKGIIRCDNSAVLPLLFHDQGVFFFLLLCVSLLQSHQVVLMWATQAALMTDWGGGTSPPSRQRDQERQMRTKRRRKWSSSWPRRRRKSHGCPWTNALWVLWSCSS